MPEQDDIKMPLTSESPVGERKEALKELFPEVFTEEGIDLEKLRLVLGEDIAVGRERYGLSWAGKSEAVRAVQIPSVGTLVPDRKQSINFDTTENLFIEGDNLEVLKLLQKSYYGKIKMIYIDPPYNTGNDFIYPDNFREGLQDYLIYSGQTDEDGTKTSTSTEISGRIHSKWLSMVYPRLYLARNLLTEVGVIFISIDDHESAALKIVCDEIFGENNHLGTIIWKNATDNNPTNIAVEHEYIHVYCRSKESVEGIWKSHVSDVKNVLVEIGEKLASEYESQDELQQAYNKWHRENKQFLWPLDRYKYIDGNGVYTGSQSVHNPGREGYRYDVIHTVTGKPCKEPLMGYRFPEETMNKLLSEGKVLFGEDESKIIELKVYASEYQEKLASVIELDGRLGAYDLKQLFPELNKIFTNPKPVRLFTHIIPFVLRNPGDIILDFFAGSCPVADAVLDLNHNDGGSRRFIMVQLPEPTPENSEAFTVGYKNIAEIGKKRIRRAINKLSRDNEFDSEDKYKNLGFRVFKLAASNFKIWDSDETPTEGDALANQLRLFADHVIEGKPEEAVLYELILKSGLPLTTKIEEGKVANKKVYVVGEGEERLLICLENELTQEALRAMMELEPRRVLCLDNAFMGNDQLKTNIVLEMKSYHIQFRTV